MMTFFIKGSKNSKKSTTPGVGLHLSGTKHVVSLLAVNKELYIGTSWGWILVCDSLSLVVHSFIHCHEYIVEHLFPLTTASVSRDEPDSQNKHRNLVVSCGHGYWSTGKRVLSNQSPPNQWKMLVWLADPWR